MTILNLPIGFTETEVRVTCATHDGKQSRCERDAECHKHPSHVELELCLMALFIL